jgi:hypothetical protein
MKKKWSWYTVDPWDIVTDPLDCESPEKDLLMVLWHDPNDLCILCLDLWDLCVSSDAEKSKIAHTHTIFLLKKIMVGSIKIKKAKL